MCNATKISDLIYAQCVTYIESEEEKTLDHNVWTEGKNPPRMVTASLIGPGNERYTILYALDCTYVKNSPTSYTYLNLIQHNTYNNYNRFRFHGGAERTALHGSAFASELQYF
jgi:hypothetical protein